MFILNRVPIPVEDEDTEDGDDDEDEDEMIHEEGARLLDNDEVGDDLWSEDLFVYTSIHSFCLS